MDYKQVILVRQDLKMPKGKMAAQVAHASLEAALKAKKEMLEAWRAEGSKKVVLKVSDEEELLKYKAMADREGLKTALIRDAGLTFLEVGTMTCLGIGPESEGKIDKVTRKLKMM